MKLILAILTVFSLVVPFNSFGQISTMAWGYDYQLFDENGYHGLTALDTTFYSDNKTILAIGNVALYRDSTKTTYKVGLWTEYYYEGQIKSQGMYQIEEYIYCGTTPFCKHSVYKIGYWQHYFANGKIKASGVYSLKFTKVRTNCKGGAKLRKGYPDKSWTFYDEEGKKIKIKDVVLTQYE